MRTKPQTVTEFSRTNIVDRVAKKSDISRQKVDRIVSLTLDAIRDIMISGSVDVDSAKLILRDFGVFQTKRTPQKEAVNFHTKQRITVPASRKVSFTPAKSFKLDLKDVK